MFTDPSVRLLLESPRPSSHRLGRKITVFEVPSSPNMSSLIKKVIQNLTTPLLLRRVTSVVS